MHAKSTVHLVFIFQIFRKYPLEKGFCPNHLMCHEAPMMGLVERSGRRLTSGPALLQTKIATVALKEDTMRHVDFSPLYRSTVGFDRVFSMLDSLAQPEQPTYPPYNIERTGENAYRISMAVAGFDESELSIELNQHLLTVKGEKGAENGEGSETLYRGIAKRAFERRFQLADHVEVKAAHLKNGLLHVDLVRNIPEAMKPRKIEILAAQKNSEPKAIEAQVVTDGETVN
jgi:molecular chaperone IbpA